MPAPMEDQEKGRKHRSAKLAQQALSRACVPEAKHDPETKHSCRYATCPRRRAYCVDEGSKHRKPTWCALQRPNESRVDA